MIDLTGAGLPSFEWGEVFHVGIRVANLEVAQRELTSSMGVRWTSPAHIPMKAWVPGEGYREWDLTISFSVEGPVHIELLHGSPGSYWDTSIEGAGLHHIGVWVDDVARANEELVRAGWVVELAARSPEEGYGGFTYTRSPAGILLEPETTRGGARERFDRWYAGGSLF
jgi:catechol 2,3-dioxygenase-like lactoylglutathione lyase family enzyme